MSNIISKKDINNNVLYNQLYKQIYKNKIVFHSNIKCFDANFLTNVILTDCDLEDISFISYFNDLIELTLINCKIEKCTKKLYNKIKTLTVSNYDNLKYINMIIEQFPDLEVLIIQNCNQVYLTALEKLKKLKEIRISNCEKIEFKNIKNENVTILEIDNTKSIQANLDNINNLKNIETIILNNCGDINIDDILCLNNLKSIVFNYNKSIKNLEKLEHYPLTSMQLHYNNFTSKQVKKFIEDIFFSKNINIKETKIDQLL